MNDPTPHDSQELCLECAMCCNGVIFADVRLQRGDDAAKLRSLLPIGVRASRFSQPCAALDGCRCNIYAERPQYCRQFECLLLKQVHSGRMEQAEALRIIRTARERADKVRQLLREVGDTDEQVALSLRFQKTSKRLEKADMDDSVAELFSQLTLAVHSLNLLLGEAFYPHSS